MNEGKIAVRYAKALFSLAKEQNMHVEVKSDLQNICTIISESPEFKQLLFDPIIKHSQKKDLVTLIFKDMVSNLTLQFLDLVFENRRETYLNSMARVYFKFFRIDQGVKSAVLTTAKAIPGDINKTIKNYISDKLNLKIELEEKADQNIIGGFILRIEDQQIDASISSHLKRIKKELLNR